MKIDPKCLKTDSAMLSCSCGYIKTTTNDLSFISAKQNRSSLAFSFAHPLFSISFSYASVDRSKCRRGFGLGDFVSEHHLHKPHAPNELQHAASR